ncbi:MULTISPECIES: hypothetical protein [Frankia]|uniref:Uncharacterized protein n=1 Tax=Candidatus Frankia alpina TaxID=2699483 RepID=A0A4V3Z829_9ACTN|nr:MULTISPECIES: hypothetical protein [Frankia]THJ76069.1 hypothetical protein E7Y31_01780 [Candidatus Frankia alpina]
MTSTAHTCNDGTGPRWGRRTAGCPRCDELAAGAQPIRWAPPRRARAVADDARRVAEIRAHDCAVSGCSVVCTFGEW